MIELPIQQLIFLFLAAVAVFAAFNVILQRNPIYSALALIVTMCALAGTFLLLDAQFVAAMQVIVYAGAVMVLFDQGTSAHQPDDGPQRRQTAAGRPAQGKIRQLRGTRAVI